MLTCSVCGTSVRADTVIEENLKIEVEGLTQHELSAIIEKHKIKCGSCGGRLEAPKKFNLMFSTTVGPKNGKSIAYLRPETAQLIFANFKFVQENARMKLPFGIAQIGKAFRNEISPRDFLFRCREFEMMEIEYFVNPEKSNECPYIRDFYSYELSILTAAMQKKKQSPMPMKVREIVNKKLMSPWHAYWLAFEQKWFEDLGADKKKFRIRQHLQEEKSHYATDTWDLEYKFPFGWKELQGISNRGDFDLKQHIKASGKDLSYYDDESKKKIVPHVIAEPSQGVERAFLVFMFDAYNYDKKRQNVVLKLHPKLAPIKVAVFPLVANKPELVKKAKEVYDDLKEHYACAFDTSGSIGRRYARNDEIGTLLGCTIDFDTPKDDSVTLRHRDTTKQIRVKIKNLKMVVEKLIEGETFDKLGTPVK
jgi:glycyl-tRNA synthetase